MPNPPRKRKKTPAEVRAQEKYIASGRQIACVIREPAALRALDALETAHGGVTAAVTAALVQSATPRV